MVLLSIAQHEKFATNITLPMKRILIYINLFIFKAYISYLSGFRTNVIRTNDIRPKDLRTSHQNSSFIDLADWKANKDISEYFGVRLVHRDSSKTISNFYLLMLVFTWMENNHRHLRNIDCLSFVMCPVLALVFQVFFLLRPLTVLIKQTRQAVHAIKQSILLICL
jgi:hypothetical protein